MRSKLVMVGIVGLTFLGVGAGVGLGVGRAQSGGVAERVGEKLDSVGRGLMRGAQDVTEGVRQRFEVVRSDVSRMGVQPRVFSRLHWDKALHDSRVEVHMLRDGVVLLRGVVPDATAKARAVALARDTYDVNGVVDELETFVPGPSPTPTSTTTVGPAVTVPSLTRPR
jgi:hyperosmotically inducible protein